ncbi:MAG: sporulation protein [Betaproteobacteria bacterium HGW-Betaproteobacteria-2]|jgi:DedD protein|nr:MAG: sporulation protein [Betaproteobacteria bacterium HGW-Betaproteobacteria-2]
MSIDEQEIQFRKRARRRLVGAIALVLLMVTVLPMVLDDRSANQPQQEIEISIPSQDDEEFTSSITPYVPESDEPQAALPDPAESNEPATSADAGSQIDDAVTASTPVTKPATNPVVEAKPAVSAAKTPTYLVQIGVFSDAANVRQLEEKLKAQGLKPSTEKVQTAQGEKIRLRVGPFDNRALAEDALAKIKATGLSGMIITNK